MIMNNSTEISLSFNVWVPCMCGDHINRPNVFSRILMRLSYCLKIKIFFLPLCLWEISPQLRILSLKRIFWGGQDTCIITIFKNIWKREKRESLGRKPMLVHSTPNKQRAKGKYTEPGTHKKMCLSIPFSSIKKSSPLWFPCLRWSWTYGFCSNMCCFCKKKKKTQHHDIIFPLS